MVIARFWPMERKEIGGFLETSLGTIKSSKKSQISVAREPFQMLVKWRRLKGKQKSDLNFRKLLATTVLSTAKKNHVEARIREGGRPARMSLAVA